MRPSAPRATAGTNGGGSSVGTDRTTPDGAPPSQLNPSDQPAEPVVGLIASASPSGIPLPPDLRSGPIIVGVDDAVSCGRPLRAAVFLARSAGRPLLLIHVRRRVMPMVEGYVPVPEDIGAHDQAEDAIEAQLVHTLSSSGDLTGVSWELVSTTGEAGAELVRLADERDAACVVVGKRHTGFADVLHRIASGSVSRAVVARHKFPVLIVP